MTNTSDFRHDTQNIKATFCFVQWSDLYNTEKPFQLILPVPDDAEDNRVTNLVWKDEEIDVHDIRGASLDPNLDAHGFQLLRCPLPKIDFTDRHAVEQVYFPEVERILKHNVPDVGQVFIFDWRLRNTLPLSAPDTILDLNDRTSFLRPATHPHVDQSIIGAVNRVLMQLKKQSSVLLKKRFRIINVWRPLIDAVVDWPLAFCDGSTIKDGDLIESDFIRRHYSGSNLFLQKRPYHKFYYMSRQGKEDVLLLKQFDSNLAEVKASCCPHGAFEMPDYDVEAPTRLSVEVRCLVFSSTEVPIPLGYHEQNKEEVIENRYAVDGEITL